MKVSYSLNAVLPLPLPAAPCLLPNNLSCRIDGQAIVYVRLNDVIFMNTIGKNDHHKIPAAAKSQIYQVRFVHVNGASLLVITSSTGAYIYNADGTNMLFFLPLHDISKIDLENQFMRGIAGASGSVFLGTSFGDLLEITIPNASPEYGVEHNKTIHASKFPIVCMDATSEYLVCGNDEGDIHCFSTSPRLHDTPVFVKSGQSYPCTSVIVRSDFTFAGFSSGHIRGYRISAGELVVEIAAHVRCIMGLALHPTENLLVSVAEDQYLCIWSFADLNSKSSKHIELVSSNLLENRLCTGVCFFAEDIGDRIGVAAYDEEDILVLNREL